MLWLEKLWETEFQTKSVLFGLESHWLSFIVKEIKTKEWCGVKLHILSSVFLFDLLSAKENQTNNWMTIVKKVTQKEEY